MAVVAVTLLFLGLAVLGAWRGADTRDGRDWRRQPPRPPRPGG